MVILELLSFDSGISHDPAALFPFLWKGNTFSHMSQSFCFLMDFKELQKIYTNSGYSLFNSPSARQMVENLPSKLFCFVFLKTCLLCEDLLCSKNFNYSSEKQILKNENILTATLNISAKNKRIRSPVCMCLSLLKYFNWEMLSHMGILTERLSSCFPTVVMSASNSCLLCGGAQQKLLAALLPVLLRRKPPEKEVSRRSYLQKQWDYEVVEV